MVYTAVGSEQRRSCGTRETSAVTGTSSEPVLGSGKFCILTPLTCGGEWEQSLPRYSWYKEAAGLNKKIKLSLVARETVEPAVEKSTDKFKT